MRREFPRKVRAVGRFLARLPVRFICRQRRIGIATDTQYRALFVMRCDVCRLKRTVRPGTHVRCFLFSPAAYYPARLPSRPFPSSRGQRA